MKPKTTEACFVYKKRLYTTFKNIKQGSCFASAPVKSLRDETTPCIILCSQSSVKTLLAHGTIFYIFNKRGCWMYPLSFGYIKKSALHYMQFFF